MPADSSAPATTEVSSAVSKVVLYEMALRNAVQLGGQKLAERALVVVPDVTLFATEAPIVRGVPLQGWGYFFDVQAPVISRSSIQVWDMVAKSRPPEPPSAPTPVAASASGSVDEARASATSADVAPDPMTVSPTFNPTSAYSSFVRDAVLDAILDSSSVLPLAPDDHLAVAVSGIDPRDANPLYRSVKLLLTVKGSDLLALRQSKITREEAKARITESRF
jgi:hypothetical protein